MKNREYWQRRSEKKLIDDLKEADSLLKSFKSAYEEAEIRISNDIQLLLGRFMTENGIDRVRAMEILEGKEFKSWRMSLEAYMEEIQRLGKSPDARALLLEVNALSTRSQINRLEALQGNISANMARLARMQEKGVEEHLSKVFREDYYRSLYDHFKEGNPKILELMAKHRVKISDSRVLAVLRTPWSGRDFSANIWRREHKIAEKVKAAVAQNVIAGKSIDRIVRDMTQELGKDYKNHAKTLIQTETAYVKAQADLESYKELEIGEYEYLATLDNKTSEVCQSLDGKVFRVEEAVSGVNFPPMHPRCRSTTVMYEVEQEGTRVARDENGKIYEVDRKMKYPEWKEKYVNGVKDEPKKVEETPPIDIIEDAKDFKNYNKNDLQNWEKEYYQNNSVSLTKEELSALDDYGEGGYAVINGVERFDESSDQYQRMLNNYREKGVEQAKINTEHLSSAIDKFDLDEDIIVHRAIRDASFITGSDNSTGALKEMIGKTYLDKGYVSTSLKYQEKFTGGKSDAVHLEIVVPKGSNGALIDKYVAKNEYEFLINKNQEFMVVDAGERTVQVEKYDLKSKQYITVDKQERYMKVQLLPDKKLAKTSKSGKIKVKEKSEAFKGLRESCISNNVNYLKVDKLKNELTKDEIIKKIAGGDMTKGSCSSLGFAYIGNVNGLDVLDFRGGQSLELFSKTSNIKKFLDIPGIRGSIIEVEREVKETMQILQNLEIDKEYYIATGKHSAIVRRRKEDIEYLELQSNSNSGWTSFTKNSYGSMATTLHKRFGCRKTVDKMFGMTFKRDVVLMEVDSFKDNLEFQELLGFINTEVGEQKKGVAGNVK